MPAQPPLAPQGLYRHYKGGLYRVIGLGRHTETDEAFVVYHRNGQPGDLWLRPSTMFFETVMIDGPDGKSSQPRFARIEGDEHE